MKKWFSLILVIAFFCCTTTGFAEKNEQTARFDGCWNGMSQGGILRPSYELMYDDYGNPYYSSGSFHWYDYETGIALLTCSHLECSHTQPVNLFDDRPLLTKMNDTSVCYAWRLSGVPITGPVMYEGKMYGISCSPDLFTETHDVGIFEMELDGPTTQVASLGHLFSWEQYPECTDFLIYDGYAYLNVLVSKNRNLDIERSEAIGDVPPSSIIYKVSLESGQITELCRINAQTCTYNLMGLVGDVLYFNQSIADGYTPMNESSSFDAWKEEYERKLCYSLLGVDIVSGEMVVLSDTLINMTCVYGNIFDIVKDNCLYVIIPPQTAAENDARFVGYDLVKRTCTVDYSFQNDTKNMFHPYYVLTDTTMLAFNFETGEFALRNLQNGEITVLDMPGACINGNDGEYYDISSVDYQPELLLLDHYHADGRRSVSYMTVEELLNNGMPHDFEMLE